MTSIFINKLQLLDQIMDSLIFSKQHYECVYVSHETFTLTSVKKEVGFEQITIKQRLFTTYCIYPHVTQPHF
jgi:hypothetical protein